MGCAKRSKCELRKTEKGWQIRRLLENRANRHAAEHERDDDVSGQVANSGEAQRPRALQF